MSQDDRQQQHIQLLRQILDAPQNTVEILSNHVDLIDQKFLERMDSLAAERRNSGQNEVAEFLTDLVRQLGDFLGLNVVEQDQQSEEAHLRFLMSLLKTVSDSAGNSQVVYSFLQKNLSYLDERLGQVLQQWATVTFTQVAQEQSSAIASILGNLGNLIQDFNLGDLSINIDLAIICHQRE